MSGSVICGLLKAVGRTIDVAETGRKVGVGGVVGRVGVGDVLDVGAGYVKEDWVLSD